MKINRKILPDNEIYSSNEIRIGKWIDGKPLYRKVVTGTLVDGDLSVDLSSLNINLISNIGGVVGYSYDIKPINFNYSGYSISTRYASNIMYINASTPYANTPFYLVLEYTKTTD